MIQTLILYYCVVWFVCVLAACYVPRETFVFSVLTSFNSVSGRLLALLLLPVLLPVAYTVMLLFTVPRTGGK